MTPLSIVYQNLRAKGAIYSILLSLVFLIYPESIAYAQNAPALQTSQVFEVKPLTQKDQEDIAKRRVLKYADVVREDRYNQELIAFLTKYNSPMVENIETLRKQPEMKRIIAISFVESNMCRRHYYNNCGGYTLSNGQLKKYESRDGWIVDTNNLLQRRYANKSYKQMLGVYVVPGSPAWLNGTTRIHSELDQLEARVNSLQYAATITSSPTQISELAQK